MHYARFDSCRCAADTQHESSHFETEKKQKEKKTTTTRENKNDMHAKPKKRSHANCENGRESLAENIRSIRTLDGHIVHQDGRVAKMNAYTMLHIKIHYSRKQRAENVNNNVAI